MCVLILTLLQGKTAWRKEETEKKHTNEAQVRNEKDDRVEGNFRSSMTTWSRGIMHGYNY